MARRACDRDEMRQGLGDRTASQEVADQPNQGVMLRGQCKQPERHDKTSFLQPRGTAGRRRTAGLASMHSVLTPPGYNT